MEIAKTYMADEKFQAAIPFLNNVINAPQNTGYKQTALLQLAVCYSNLNKNQEALDNYKKLLQQYPNSEEAAFALENIRAIYVETGRPQEYEAFVRSTGRNVSASEADSLAYAAVEVKLENNDCTGAVELINSYQCIECTL
jgi:tetratricopeptide (TPR) repeat protein